MMLDPKFAVDIRTEATPHLLNEVLEELRLIRAALEKKPEPVAAPSKLRK